MKSIGTNYYDNLDLIEKKIVYLLGAKLRNKDRIMEAITKQDMIRKKHSRRSDWNSVAQIRKWRDVH